MDTRSISVGVSYRDGLGGGDDAGEDAVYVVAFVSGLTDVDALTLSTSRLFANGQIESGVAWRAIFLGSLSNLLFKTAFAAIVPWVMIWETRSRPYFCAT